MPDVFISHSSNDRDAVKKMSDYLESRGLSCWMAFRDIEPGDDWAYSISSAITEAKVFLVVYSKNCGNSKQTSREISLADNKENVIIVPYKIDDSEPAGAFEYYLYGAHWIEANYAKGDYKLEELYETITRRIAKKKHAAPKADESVEKTDTEDKTDKKTETVEIKEAVAEEKKTEPAAVKGSAPQKAAAEESETSEKEPKAKQTPITEENKKRLIVFSAIIVGVIALIVLSLNLKKANVKDDVQAVAKSLFAAAEAYSIDYYCAIGYSLSEISYIDLYNNGYISDDDYSYLEKATDVEIIIDSDNLPFIDKVKINDYEYSPPSGDE